MGASEDDHSLRLLKNTKSIYELAMESISLGVDLKTRVRSLLSDETVDYDQIARENRLLGPLDHPDPAHCLVSGTGLDHLGSAIARNAMHADMGELTDSMKMFNIGLESGKPQKGEVGAQPEWFYKGDGSCVVPPGHDFQIPAFSEDAGEEV